MKEPRSCKYSKGYKGTYICTLCLLPCERVKVCPLDKEEAEAALKEVENATR